jgi:AcrR family transcriptional regulator
MDRSGTSPPEPLSTRERLLDVAEELTEQFGHRLTVVQVARAGKVSRQTVYLLFGDRVGLLGAMWRRRGLREPKIQAMYAALGLPPLEAFEGFFRNWIRAAIKLERWNRTIWIEEQDDPDLRKMLRMSDERFRTSGYHVLFQKLYDAGYLRSIWTVEQAVDAAWQTTMYLITVGHIRNMRGWTPKQIEECGLKVLRATFLTADSNAPRTMIR